LRQKYNLDFRIHVDAAYGGYFSLAGNLEAQAASTFALISRADSVVIDPHKHGYQPYGCGCVIFADPTVGSLYKHDSPYTYFSSAELHLGEISLECSRPGAAAAALWATQKMFPLERGGEFATNIEKCRKAALKMYESLDGGDFFLPLKPELDILIYAPRAPKASEISALSRRIFHCAAQANLHLALATLPASLLQSSKSNMNIDWDQQSVTVLRSCLLKPEHLDWSDQIVSLLQEATSTARNQHKLAGAL